AVVPVGVRDQRRHEQRHLHHLSAHAFPPPGALASEKINLRENPCQSTICTAMSVKKLLDLSGKVALVTGGSRGLGLQIAEALGEMGAKLALTARKPEELEQARAHLARQSVEALPLACDLSQP